MFNTETPSAAANVVAAAMSKRVDEIKEKEPNLRHSQACLKAKRWAVSKFGYGAVAEVLGLPKQKT